MYGHEYESDEDCEVYFLKPVNEYNIVDKIKEANKELFADEAAVENGDDGTTMITTTNRKVTFALNLEHYEPVALREKLSCESDEKNGNAQEAYNDLAAEHKFPAIDEQDEVDEIILEPAVSEVTSRSNNEAFSEAVPGAKVNEVHDLDGKLSSAEQNENLEEVEEICEEIITMDMEESRTSSLDSQQQRKKMLKQATFDHGDLSNDDEDNNDADGEEEEDTISDTKSSADPLCSDAKPAEGSEDLGTTVEESEELADDEEDDQLSIIVASYIPDDYEKHTLLVDCDFRRKHKFVKPKKNPFTKRFSFRRKTNNTTAGNSIMERHQPPPGVTDLKLNYKTCCEYRHAIQEKLPKYTGYLSEYGLTREQLEKREEKWQQKQRSILEKSLQANAQEMRKMQDNERAFTTWLKQKMRFPINKTRNMFDVKFSVGGGCSSGSAVRNRCNSGKIK